MTHTELLLQSALTYLSYDFSVIPVDGKTKIPIIQWKEYQDRRASKEEIESWIKQYPDMDIGIVTGSISNLIVIDQENGADFALFSRHETPTVITGGGGRHFYFSYIDESVANAVRFMPLTDIRSTGGYVVAPPSKHKSGNNYVWDIPLGSVPIKPLPQIVLDELKKGKTTNGHSKKDWREMLKGVEQGKTHNTATSIIGKLLHHLPAELWDSVVWNYLVDSWNVKNKKPLPDKEIRRIYEDFANNEITKQKLTEEAQAEFDVIEGSKIGDLLILNTTYGKVDILSNKFLHRRDMEEAVFNSTLKNLPEYTVKKWREMIRKWSSRITLVDLSTTFETFVISALQDVVKMAKDTTDLALVNRGIPAKFENGVIFKLPTLLKFLDKGLKFTFHEVAANLRSLGCVPRQVGAQRLRVWFVPSIEESNDEV